MMRVRAGARKGGGLDNDTWGETVDGSASFVLG